MIVADAHGNPVTASSCEAVALLDATVSAYLGFRQDTGDQAGVDVGDRWQELAVRSEAHIDDHLLTFGDVHYLLALPAAAAARDTTEAIRELA